jgi:hypothetical protein
MLRVAHQWLDRAGGVLMMGALGTLVIKATSFAPSDFSAYYFGSLFWRQGRFDRAIYETTAFNQRIMEEGTIGFVSYTPFPPITAPLYAPFTFVDVPTAKVLFNLVSVVLFMFTVLRMLASQSIGWRYAPFILLIFFVPVRNNVFFGQAYLLLCVLVMEGMLAYERRQWTLSAVWWGLAIVWKVFPVVLLLFLLWQRDWLHSARTAASCAGWIILGILATGVDIWAYYAASIFPRILNGEFNDTFTVSYQTFFVWLRILFVSDALANPNPVVDSQAFYIAGLILYKALTLAIVTGITRKASLAVLLKVGLWMMAALLLSSGGTTYSLILLLPLVLALGTDRRAWSMYLALAGIMVAVNLPVGWVSSWPGWLQFPRLFLLLAVLGILVMRFSPAWSWPVAAVYAGAMIAVVVTFQWPAKDPAEYASGMDRSELIYDFRVRGDSLLLDRWTENGPSTRRIQWPETVVLARPLEVRNNQIWFEGRRITNSGDNKKKPLLVNNSYVLFLSDYGRGVGFYTLRKVPLL